MLLMLVLNLLPLKLLGQQLWRPWFVHHLLLLQTVVIQEQSCVVAKKPWYCKLITNQTEMMSMKGLRHPEARLYSGMDIVYLVFLQCRGPLVIDI